MRLAAEIGEQDPGASSSPIVTVADRGQLFIQWPSVPTKESSQMSAPPISRPCRRAAVSVVRDAAAVWQVLDDDPIESCMVAARVADHGIDPNAIGEAVDPTRRAQLPTSSRCAALMG